MKRASLFIFYGLLAYMPLHILLSTWLGTSLGVLDFAKVFKDVILFIGFGLALAASFKKPWFKSILKDRLLWLISAYAALTLLLVLFKPTDQDAEILGVVYNLRFLLFFIYAMLLARLFEPSQLLRNSLKVVMSVGLLVLIFGVLQYTVLPDSIMERVGYSRENGALPAFFIDNKPDLERVMSTIRDPNSFGAFIIIILSISLTYLLATKNPDIKKVTAGFVGLSTLTLWYTFSRSAWIGALLSVAAVFALRLKTDRNFKLPKKYLMVAGVLIVLSLLFIIPLRNTYFVQNVIFHADQSTVLEDPNELRQRFLQESVAAAVDNPLGYGPGTAGLASIRNNVQGTTLNENYYLQILHEVGLAGLLLFLSILIIVAIRLYSQVSKPFAVALLAALIGIAFTNLLVHIWANEAVSYTWWGLAGLVVFTSKKKATKK